MTYAARPADFHTATPCRPAKRQAARRGFWRALIDAVLTAHQRDAQREIDRLVARSGGKLTDSLEREIGEHMNRTWSVGP